VSNIGSLEKVIAESISQPRFYMLLLAIFASVALMLAAIGIFGVLSYAVSQRTREIGIRMALGAPGRTVVNLIVRQAMLLVVSGVAAGTIAALYVSPDDEDAVPRDADRSRDVCGRRRRARRRRAVCQLRARAPRNARGPHRGTPRRLGFRLWALGGFRFSGFEPVGTA
jgi:hypothetical protein